MTIDEAISHAMEVAERQEYLSTQNHGYCEEKRNVEAREQCAECAADHRQLAEWLKELKELRSIIEACNILAVDAFAVERLCKELKEAKRLLKMAVKDINSYVDCYEAHCDECCCSQDNHCHWKHEAEALKLIGESNEP